MTESQHVKRKESWRDEYLKWICAFTNAQGGVLEVGRDDRGKDATQEIPIATPESIRTTREKSDIAQEPNLTTQELTEATQEILPTTQEHTQTTQEGVSQPAPTIAPERILALLKAEPRITRRLMAERIGITPHGVKYHLAKLRKAGIIRHVGPTKAGRWEMLK